MAVKIRLRRIGAKKKPYFRVTVADARQPKEGRFIEIIGRYDPRQEPSLIEIDEEKAIYWLARGAQPSNTVENLFQKTGIREKF